MIKITLPNTKRKSLRFEVLVPAEICTQKNADGISRISQAAQCAAGDITKNKVIRVENTETSEVILGTFENMHAVQAAMIKLANADLK